MKNSDPLLQLVTTFELWRINRANRNAPTPAALRCKAVLLKTHYSSSKIARALRISGSQLKLWSRECQHLDDDVEFVSLPAETDIINTQPDAVTVLEFTLPQGEQIRLTGAITATFMATMIKEMRG